MNFFTFSGVVTSVTTFILGIFVLFRGGIKRRLYRIFSIYSFAISLWGLAVSFFGPSLNDQYLFYGRLLHIGAILIPVFYLHFTLLFLEVYKNKRAVILVAYLIATVFLYLNLFSKLLIKDITHRRTYSFPTPGLFYPLFFLFFFLCITYSLSKLYLGYRQSTGNRSNQIKYLFWGSLLGYTGGLNNFLITADIEIFPLHPFGAYAIPAYVAIATYAILRYRLMDISVTITRTGVFIALYTLVLGIPFLLATGGRAWLIDILGVNWLIGPLLLMAILATAGPFLYIYLEKRAEAILLREQRRYQETLKQAAIGMTRIRSLDKLLNLIVHILTKTVRISYSAIYLYDPETTQFLLRAGRNLRYPQAASIAKDSSLVVWLYNQRQPLVFEEIKRKAQDTTGFIFKEIESQMQLVNASVLIPSFLEDKLTGFLILGDKRTGQIYTSEDLDVFQVLASQSALAIENAQFILEAKAMQEQIAHAEKMATIGTMADGLSHQINNRLHALSMIAGDTIDTLKFLNTDNLSPDTKELISQVNYALERIQANVMQGKEVVEGLLKYSRKSETGLSIFSLNEVLDGSTDMVAFKIKLSEIDINRHYPKDLPKIKGSLVQLQEVFFNFIDNAYDSIIERRSLLKEPGYRGKIDIWAEYKDSTLEIIFQDNGLGIKDEDRRKVFTPFFTTKVSSRKGTGLGLYVIQRIINEFHHGRIRFESAYGQGTRFIIELPPLPKE